MSVESAHEIRFRWYAAATGRQDLRPKVLLVAGHPRRGAGRWSALGAARILAKLLAACLQISTLRHLGKHRNIVSLHDVLYSPNETIMFTDLVQGGELFDYIVDMVRCLWAYRLHGAVQTNQVRMTGFRVGEGRKSLAARRLPGARVHALARNLVRAGDSVQLMRSRSDRCLSLWARQPSRPQAGEPPADEPEPRCRH